LEAAGVPIWGTPAAAIHAAEDRDEFHALCLRLGIPQPDGGVAAHPEQAAALAESIGYPVMVRPSYVLGGRAMMAVRSREELDRYLAEVYSELPGNPSILVDDYLEGAREVDVDALCDGETAVVAGIMEHVEAAGIHSGDSACIIPPVSLPRDALAVIDEYTVKLALAIGVRGLINVQYVYLDGVVYVIEANPRASRTIPYLSKAIGHPLAKYAALIAAGRSLAEIGFTSTPAPVMYSVKEAVLPFLKFSGVNLVLGPEMRSTGESMGIDRDPYLAYYRAALSAGSALPAAGRVLALGAAGVLAAELKALEELGFTVLSEPDGADYDLLIDVAQTPELRRALEAGVPYVSTPEAAQWTVRALQAAAAARRRGPLGVTALQDLALAPVSAD